MHPFLRAFARYAAIVGLAVSASVFAQQPITLHGAVQFNDGHAFNRALEKFQELTAKYYGKPINFVLHKNSELGLEKDYFAYMNQGISVDYGIVSPAHMSTFSKAAPFIDAPFLFRDLDHWNKVLDADTLKPIADEVAAKGDVMLIGFAGGGTRNIFANKPVRNLQEMKGLKVRVQGAPIWSKTFTAVGMSPTVIAYDEIYNAIQNGVIQAGENEAAGVEAMKFYEVGPNLNMTQHAITIRPICFSGKTFKKLPPDLQAAILKAGKEAGIYGRQIESSEDQKKLEAFQAAGKLKMIPFTDRAQMKKLADPVMVEYAKEIGAPKSTTRSIPCSCRNTGRRQATCLAPAFYCLTSASRSIECDASSTCTTTCSACCSACPSASWCFRSRSRSSRVSPTGSRTGSGPRRWPASCSSGW